MTAKRRQMSVYPDDEVAGSLGGWSSKRFNLALALFGEFLAEQPDKWNELDNEEQRRLIEILGFRDLANDGRDIKAKMLPIIKLRGHKKLHDSVANMTNGELWRIIFHHIIK